MAHLDTAYKLGSLKAAEDFDVELHKSAEGYDNIKVTPPPVNKGKIIPGQKKPVMPPPRKAPKAPDLPDAGVGDAELPKGNRL